MPPINFANLSSLMSLGKPYPQNYPGAPSAGFNINPAPQAGNGAFGKVPGAVGLAPNTYSQVGGVLPNLAALTSGTGSVIGSELSGQISPATMNALKNASATFGTASGMPGSQLGQNGLFANIAGFSENRQRQGVNDFNSTLQGLAATQTNPELAFQVADRNATMASAPDPEAAAKQQLALFDKYYNQGSGAADGSGGWPGARKPPTVTVTHTPYNFGGGSIG
jgi:hypothetical protein